jgi:hypothetical protein
VQGQEVLFLSTVSRLAKVPNAWVLKPIFLEVKWLHHQYDHSPPFSATVPECSELQFHSFYIFKKWKYFRFSLKHIINFYHYTVCSEEG